MKYISAVICSLIMLTSFGQDFGFPLTSRTLIKTTNQSPAHWYLEVMNNYGVDTTLRWKTSFLNVPNEWSITFDDQNSFHNPIESGDSADFTLFHGLSFPQKLIIGAVLNNTPGHGFIYFDIFDPENSTEIRTIYFEFIVTENTSSVQHLESDDSWYSISDGVIYVNDQYQGNVLNLYNLNGELIHSQSSNKPLYVPNDLRGLILVLETDGLFKSNRISIISD